MAEAMIIDGKAAAERLMRRVESGVATLRDIHGCTPGLAVVRVGNDPASEIYVRNKVRQSKEAGMKSFDRHLPADLTEEQLLTTVRGLNKNGEVNGILVQLPLPPQIDPDTIMAAVAPEKDVDGFHAVNAGLVAKGELAKALVPCTPQGCLMLIKEHRPELAGLDAVVVGRSNIVGKPVAALLLAESCTVTIAHSRTKDLAEVCRRADIVIAAVGRPRLVKGDWIKEGATVIDVGINRIEEGGKTRLVGDVDFDSTVKRAGAITPVPGGVGPMTIACLLRNTLIAACRQKEIPLPDGV
jgi:methylenetetrahydrofolate dehydrogenase (NADP+)/methenyltetrahydrofolate cyclohydrolase